MKFLKSNILSILSACRVANAVGEPHKDAEIAMGACQPQHTWSNKKRHPIGQVCLHMLIALPFFVQVFSLPCVGEKLRQNYSST